jgi:prophage tail gpP-like protein
MQHEKFTISAGGGSYDAFFDCQVSAAFNEAAREASFTVAFEAGKAGTNAIFAVGTEITILISGDPVLTGYVDVREPSFAAKKAEIVVTARSKSADLVDGSAEHETGQFEDKDPLEIAQEISSKYGAKWESDQQLEKIEQYQVTPGESCFRCVEKLTRQQGMTITGTPEGNAKITKAGSDRNGAILEGENLFSGTAHHNGKNRYSQITVRGQRPYGHGDDNLEIEVHQEDGQVKRHRRIILIEDQDTTKDRAEKRAKNRKNRAAGDALRATITMQACHDDGGKLWTPGALTYVESPSLDLSQDMLIEKAVYRQSSTGSFTTLSLVDPQAYGGQGAGGGKGNKSGDSWGFG